VVDVDGSAIGGTSRTPNVDVDRATQLASLVMDTAYPRAWVWWKDGAHTVQTWMSSGSLEVYLRRVFEGHVDHPDASKWAAACDVLEAIRR